MPRWRALGADYLVEGHVRRGGDRLRITAQLIEAHEETHVWANTFDRVMTDALVVQTEIAVEIAKGVTAALSSNQSGVATLRLRVPEF
jgi:adenylate cyclase